MALFVPLYFKSTKFQMQTFTVPTISMTVKNTLVRHMVEGKKSVLIDWICSVFNFQEYSQQNFNRKVYFLFSTAYVHNTKMQADLALFQTHFFLFHQFLLYLKILNIMQKYFLHHGIRFQIYYTFYFILLLLSAFLWTEMPENLKRVWFSRC